ncbi:hypothetical protein CHLRE_07g331700v5 [Chlamydomonas reinhardtii]|uniref:Uncharacterized protein n=1 Tax=Chlamydomonas reinhardtii TaxID=3055 RepID=A0A2K3DJW9_CHLRE|nr:uncharacterized protein CHLRE_07g331700v5 [Chlamydomonas reinhardtii]PNW80839.1 hypothetical protein CHLRE_07g331700v5 [Chlamydomonas reinhardtii]
MLCSCIYQDAVAHPHARAAAPDATPPPADGHGFPPYPPPASLATPLTTPPGLDAYLASAAVAAQAQAAAGARPGAPKPRGQAGTTEDVSVRRAAGLAFVTPSGHLNLPPLDFDALTGLSGGGSGAGADAAGAGAATSGGGVRRSFLAPAGGGGGGGGALDFDSYMDPWLLPSRPITGHEGTERGAVPARGRRGPAAAAAAALGGKARRQRHYHQQGPAEDVDVDAGGASSKPQSRDTTEYGYLAQLAPPPQQPQPLPFPLPQPQPLLATSRSAAAASTAATDDTTRPFSGCSSVMSGGGGGGVMSGGGGGAGGRAAAAAAAAAGHAGLPDIAEGIWSGGGRGRGGSRTYTGATDVSAAADDEGEGADDDRRERRWVRRLLAGLRGADGRTRTPSVVVFTQRRPPLNQRRVGQTWWTKIKGWVAAGRGAEAGAAGGGGGGAASAADAADGDPAPMLAGAGANGALDSRARPHTGRYSDVCEIGSVCVPGDSQALSGGLGGGAAALGLGLDQRLGGGFGATCGGPDIDYSHRTATSRDSSPDTSARYRRDSSPARQAAAAAPAQYLQTGKQPRMAPPPPPLPQPQSTPSTMLLPPLSPGDGFGHKYDLYSRAGTPIGGVPHKAPVPPLQLQKPQQRPSNPRYGHRPAPPPPPPPPTSTAAAAATAATEPSVYDADLSVHGGNAVLLYDGSQHHEQVLQAYGMLQPMSRDSPVSRGSSVSCNGGGKAGGAAAAPAPAHGHGHAHGATAAAAASAGGDEAGSNTQPCYSRSGSGASGAAAAAADGCGSLVGAGGSRRGLRACASLRHAPSPPLPLPPAQVLTDLETDVEADAEVMVEAEVYEEDAAMAALHLAQSLTLAQSPQAQPQQQSASLHGSDGTVARARHGSLARAPVPPVPAAPAPAARTLESAFANASAQAQPNARPQAPPPDGLSRTRSERAGGDASPWTTAAAASPWTTAAAGAATVVERKARGVVADGRVRGGTTFRTFLSQNPSHPGGAAAHVKLGGGGSGAGLNVGTDVDVPIFDVLQRAAPGSGQQHALPLRQPPVRQPPPVLQLPPVLQPAFGSTLMPAASSPSPLTRTPTQDLADSDEYVGDTLPPPHRRVRPRRHTDATGGGDGAAYGGPVWAPSSSASPMYAAAATPTGYGPRLHVGNGGGGGGGRRGPQRVGSTTGGRGSASNGAGASGHVWGSGLSDSNASDGGGAELDVAARLQPGSGVAPAGAAGAAPLAAPAATDWLHGYLPGSLSRDSGMVLP